MVLSWAFWTEHEYNEVVEKYAAIEKEIQHLKVTTVPPGTPLDEILAGASSAPLRQSISLYDLLKRPEINYEMISDFDGTLKNLGPQVIAQVEYEIKYEGFIHRQQKDVEKFRHIEYIRIPGRFLISTRDPRSFP